MPIIEVLINRLIRFGITDITLTLGHLAELVKAYFQHRQHLLKQITLRYVEEEEPSGTAGSLALVPGLDQTFLLTNGDLLTNLDVNALIQFHQRQKATLTIASHTRKVMVDLGVLEIGADHQITGYREKPQQTYHVSMGIYVCEPGVLQHIEPRKYLDFPDLVLRLLERGEKVCAYTTDCLWLDIGRPEDYAKAQQLFEEKAEEFDRV